MDFAHGMEQVSEIVDENEELKQSEPENEKDTCKPLDEQTKKLAILNNNHIDDCPICMQKSELMYTLSKCQHPICIPCLREYIITDIKNLAKYPFKCYHESCSELLQKCDCDLALNSEEISIFDNFSTLCALRPTERDNCPQCYCIFFIENHNNNNIIIENNNRSLKDKRDINNCELCKDRLTSNNKKHNCKSCGDVFCAQCCNFQIPVSASNEMLINYYTNHVKSKSNGIGWVIKKAKSIFDKKISTEKPSMFVKSCSTCYLSYYCAECPSCRYSFCKVCKKPWHPNYDCGKEMVEKIKTMRVSEDEKKMNNYIKDNNLARCPGCGMIIMKYDGCNHITHLKCPNPSYNSDTHFCYICNELLYPPTFKQEQDGTLHFPISVYRECKNSNTDTSSKTTRR